MPHCTFGAGEPAVLRRRVSGFKQLFPENVGVTREDFTQRELQGWKPAGRAAGPAKKELTSARRSLETPRMGVEGACELRKEAWVTGSL